MFSRKRSGSSTVEDTITDVDEQRKIAEGADALLNLAGVALNHNSNTSPRVHHSPEMTTTTTTIIHTTTVNHAIKVSGIPSKSKRRSTSSDYSSLPDKRRRRWREWGDSNRYLKQVRG